MVLLFRQDRKMAGDYWDAKLTAIFLRKQFIGAWGRWIEQYARALVWRIFETLV